MNENTKETITLSNQIQYNAVSFSEAIKDVSRLIRDILRLSKDCQISANEIADRTYVLDWMTNDAEIKDMTN